MGLRASIQQSAMEWAIKTALQKRPPVLIPTSGDRAKSNDCYCVYLLDKEGLLRFLVSDLIGTGIIGKWSHDGSNFTDDRIIVTSDLPKFVVYIQHYYRTMAFDSVGVLYFILYRWSGWPWVRVTFDRLQQSRFNRKALVRQNRMDVLAYILAETVKNGLFQVHVTTLLTHLYSVRWVLRHDKDELVTYYRFLLDALLDSGDLERTEHCGYKLKPKALNTISEFVQEERRHGDNYKNQRGILWLTIALIFIGLLQAGAAAYEQWLKPPETFTGTIGGQPIDLIQK